MNRSRLAAAVLGTNALHPVRLEQEFAKVGFLKEIVGFVRASRVAIMPTIPVRAFLVSVVAIRAVGTAWEVLLLKRTRPPTGAWCQVAGSIEEGEAAWQAALRELLEETGLMPEALYSADICEQFYEAGQDSITMAPAFVAIIDRARSVTLNHEHSQYRWVDFSDAIDMVDFGGQRRVLRWIEDEFVKRAPSRHLRIEN